MIQVRPARVESNGWGEPQSKRRKKKPMNELYNITLKILRYDPSSGKRWTQQYNLQAGGILRFTDLFRKINVEQDPTLAWNSSCEHGQCGSCAVKVNGRPLLACELLVANAVEIFGTSHFSVEPISVGPVARDLIVDLEPAYKRVETLRPYIIKRKENIYGSGEYRIAPQEMEAYLEATRCINCFCCATACMSGPKNFLGPNSIMASMVRALDPREAEAGERLRVLHGPQGVRHCHTSRACSHVCPKEIDVAHFVALAKAANLKNEKDG